MYNLQDFINSFLSINPRPTKKQVEYLMFSLGISDFEIPDFCQSVLSASAKLTKTCALTEGERVLNNDYDPAITDTDNLLINDGDNLTKEENLGDQDALRVDGPVDDSSISEFEAHNGR